jgi:hypothetical protein
MQLPQAKKRTARDQWFSGAASGAPIGAAPFALILPTSTAAADGTATTAAIPAAVGATIRMAFVADFDLFFRHGCLTETTFAKLQLNQRAERGS